ncbi:MAG TPA: acyl carrier protein [Candidatus Omnitrophica bacterium]|nr:acyl carrier protein [Candidatus Omnitrophota bacterium]
MTQNTTQEILGVVSTILEKEPSEIPLDAHLIQDVGADSMMALEILAALEKKYKIVIPEDKLKDMTTLNKIVSLVETAKKRK